MRQRRAAAIWALVAFLLGVALGPVLGWERQTVFADSVVGVNRIRNMPSDGWIVGRTDIVFPDARMVTFERPRIIGLTKSAGDAFNQGAGWVAWATSSGAYAKGR